MIVETRVRSIHAVRTLALAIGLLAAVGPASTAAAQDVGEPETRINTAFYPRDAARTDPDLARLRDALLEASRKRDVALLVREFADDIRFGLKLIDGREEVPQDLKDAMGEDPEGFWRDLETALTRGIALQGKNSAVAPYTFLAADFTGCSGNCVVITGSGVRARSAPSSSAPVVDVLAYHILLPHDEYPAVTPGTPIDGDQHQWQGVITPSGKRGFVLRKYVYELTGYRFFFTKVGGRWRVSEIHAGC